MDNLQVNYEEIKVDIEDLLILRDSWINEKVDMPQIRGKRDVVNSVEELMNQYEALGNLFVKLINNTINFISCVSNEVEQLDEEISVDISE